MWMGHNRVAIVQAGTKTKLSGKKKVASCLWIYLFQLKVSSACVCFLEFAFNLYESE